MQSRTCNNQSELRGTKAVLKRFTDQHITEKYLAWLNNKSLMRFSQQSLKSHTRDTCLAYLRSFDHSPNLFWSIHLRSSMSQVGTITASVDTHNCCADIGILVGDDSVRGTGLGQEAWELVISYLFGELKLARVTGGTVVDHHAMIRIFERAGMLPEAFLEEKLELNGVEYPLVRYRISREDWLAMRDCSDPKGKA